MISNDDFLMIKGKQMFAIYFPNVDLLMIKGKQIVAIYFPKIVFLMIKGKHIFAIYFPNADFLMIKGKQHFVMFEMILHEKKHKKPKLLAKTWKIAKKCFPLIIKISSFGK